MIRYIVKHMRFIHLILVALVFVSLHTADAAGQRWPGRSWQVKSSYYSPAGGKDSPFIFWSFTRHSNQFVSVRDAHERVGFRAELTFDRSHALVTAEYFSRIRNKEIKINRFFDPESLALLEDSLIPCDWINAPLPLDGESRHFSIKKKVGKSASFAANIRMTGESIDIHEAEDRKMISTEVKNRLSSKDLMLVRIEKIDKNGVGQEILRQLWSTDVPFWLYEATPFRQSWYIME